MQDLDMASSITDPWILSLDMDELQAECKARSGNARVFRVPSYIRNRKPSNYDPDLLPMGIYNRDFRKKTPMDQLKLEVVGAFLEHLHIDHNRWKRFCTEVAHAERQVSDQGASAPRLEHFYQDDGRPSYLTPEVELSVLIIDAFFVVADLIYLCPTYLVPRALLKHIWEIFSKRGVVCHLPTIFHDMLWLYENQIPLYLVENVWAEAVKPPRAENQSGGFGFHDVTVRYLQEGLRSAGFPYKVDVNGEYRKCDHLLACLHRALCTGTRSLMDNDSETRPLMENDTITGWFKSYVLKVPVVIFIQLLNFTEQMVSAVCPCCRPRAQIHRQGISEPRRTDPDGLIDHDGPSFPPTTTVVTVPSATRLWRTGIRFKGVETNIGDIRFVKSPFHLTATLYLPKMLFQDMSEKLLLNLCVYEYMNADIHYVTNFVQFMDELIDSEEDVDLLTRGNDPVIVANFVGSNKEVANIFANLLQHFMFQSDERLTGIRSEIRTWYNARWRRHLRGFVDRFAIAPWLLGSLIAAAILLVLTLLQTIYTMLGFYKQR